MYEDVSMTPVSGLIDIEHRLGESDIDMSDEELSDDDSDSDIWIIWIILNFGS